MQSPERNSNVFFLPLYENYAVKTDPAKIYKYKEINLIDGWNSKQSTTYRTRRYKPVDFKKLYKKLSVLKKQYKKSSLSHWITAANSQNFSQNSLNISKTSSYLLRALNNFQLYKHQRIPHYKSFYLKGFTFEKEKVFDKKKRILNNTLFFYSCFKLHEKVYRQKKIEKKFFC